MLPLQWYPHPREQQVLSIAYSLLFTASNIQPQAGQKVPDAELRAHSIPGGVNFKEQLKDGGCKTHRLNQLLSVP